jgi:hypothetical protein
MGMFSTGTLISEVDELAVILPPLFEKSANWEKVEKFFVSSKYDDGTLFDSDESRANEVAKLLNLPLLGYGSYRAVLEVNSYAVKVPIESMGNNENYEEFATWSEIPEALRSDLARFILIGTNWAVFEKVKGFESLGEFTPYIPQALDILKRLKSHYGDIEDFDVAVERYGQWGLRSEKLVIVDYGNFCR